MPLRGTPLIYDPAVYWRRRYSPLDPTLPMCWTERVPFNSLQAALDYVARHQPVDELRQSDIFEAVKACKGNHPFIYYHNQPDNPMYLAAGDTLNLHWGARFVLRERLIDNERVLLRSDANEQPT